MARRLENCLLSVLSIKAVLIISFIVLMAISGALGFALTYIQGQKSMNDVAEISMNEAAYTVILGVKGKLSAGHQLNLMENTFFLKKNITLDNFVAAHYHFRFLTIQNLVSVWGTYVWSVLYWLPNALMATNVMIPAVVFFNLNSTICNDTVNFPGSNCAVPNEEMYPLDVNTGSVVFSTPIMTIAADVQTSPYWITGPLTRLRRFNWKFNLSAPSFSPGYTSIYPTPTKPTFLIIQLNSAVINAQGDCVGSNGKDLSLDFVNTLLQELVFGNPLLAVGGRAFVYEQSGLLLIGASHGNIYIQRDCSTCPYGWDLTRLQPHQSSDLPTSTCGKALYDSYQSHGIIPGEFNFDVGSEQYKHVSKPLTDEYGLNWMVSILLSLTELFKDITSASMRMLGITAGVVVGLSLSASFGITFAVLRPLHQLTEDMECVSGMKLENINPKKSHLREISVMQGYFVNMVNKLMEYRAFLPEAILNSEEDDEPEIINRSDDEEEPSALTKRKQTTATTLEVVDSRSSVSSEGAMERKPTSKSVISGRSVSASSSHRKSRGASTFDTNAARRKSGVNKQVGSLTKRYLSCLQVDIRSFHQQMENDAILLALHTDVVNIMTEAVQQNFGLCNPILGDKMIAVWNVKSMKADHAVHCATAALQIQSGVNKLQALRGEFNLLGVRMACTAGFGMFGSMGTKSCRTFTTISACISRGFGLQKLGKLIPYGVVCGAAIQERISFRYNTRLVCLLPSVIESTESTSVGVGAGGQGAGVQFTTVSNSGPEKIYEILDSGDGAVDEWMYELKQKESQQSKNVDFELGVRALYSGNEPSANQHFRSYVASHPDDKLAQWYATHGKDVATLLSSTFGLVVPFSLFH